MTIFVGLVTINQGLLGHLNTTNPSIMSLVSPTMTGWKSLQKWYICCSQGRWILILHEDWKQGEPAGLDLSKMSRAKTFNVYYLPASGLSSPFSYGCGTIVPVRPKPVLSDHLCRSNEQMVNLLWIKHAVCRTSGDILAEIIFIAVFSPGNQTEWHRWLKGVMFFARPLRDGLLAWLV